MRIYLASSWRNTKQPLVLAALRSAGHEVYDFRNPGPGDTGFGWRQLGQGDPKEWTPEQFRQVLQHPTSQRGFGLDMKALREAEATVLLLPCGRSAHLELGYAVGAGQRTIVLLDEKLDEPELMYLMCSEICLDVAEVVRKLAAEPVKAQRPAVDREEGIRLAEAALVRARQEAGILKGLMENVRQGSMEVVGGEGEVLSFRITEQGKREVEALARKS